MAAHLAEGRIEPELILCSSSRRTRETLEGVLPGREAVIQRELYEATTENLMDRLHRVAREISSVMLVGHNPALQMLVLWLARPDINASSLADLQRKFPTGALATLDFTCAWTGLGSGTATLRSYVRPKSLA